MISMSDMQKTTWIGKVGISDISKLSDSLWAASTLVITLIKPVWFKWLDHGPIWSPYFTSIKIDISFLKNLNIYLQVCGYAFELLTAYNNYCKQNNNDVDPHITIAKKKETIQKS